MNGFSPIPLVLLATASLSVGAGDLLSYRYAPRSAAGLDTNALNIGVYYSREKPPLSPNCTYICPLANSPTTGTVTYAFQTVGGKTLQNIIASQRASLFGPGSVLGDYSTDGGRSFQRFFEAVNSSAETRANLRSLNTTNVQIRYTLIVPSSWNYQVQLGRDCDTTPFAWGFDFDVPVEVVVLPRTLTVPTAPGGTTTMSPNGPVFTRGTTVELAALPEPGFVFRGWFGDVVSFDNPLTVVMDEVKTITPILAPVSGVNHCTSAPSDIASWWTADGAVLDLITGHAGTLDNGAFLTRGYSDFGFSFDGFDEYVQLGEAPVSPPWTATMWVLRRNAQGGSAALLADGTSALKVEQAGTARKVGFTRYGVTDYAFSYSVPANTWTHLAFVATGGTTRLYVNGALEDSVSATVPLPRYRLGIKVPSPPTDAFNGVVDEIAVFKRALATDEIAAIYSSGSSSVCKPAEFVNVALENNDTLELRVRGPIGHRITVSQSKDLSTWSVLGIKDNPEGFLTFSQPSSSAEMFFRLDAQP